MSTEGTDTIDTSTATTDTVGIGDEFTADELAYFESRGEKEIGGEPAPAAKANPVEKPEGNEQATDDDPDGTISIDEQGRARDKKSGKFVPHGVFHKEREGRKAAETELSTLREKVARADERLAILSQAFETDKPAATAEKPAITEPPDPTKDIFGFADWAQKTIANLTTQLEATKTETNTKLGEIEIGRAYASDAQAFARQTPDFVDAYKHLTAAVDAELQLMGVTDPKQRSKEIARLEREQVEAARKAGRRPAEHIYQLAKVRGWTPKPAAADPAKTTGDPKSQPNAAEAAAAAELDRLAKGQNAARTLSSAGGGAPAPLTAESLAGMSEEEFSALLSKGGGNTNATLRKLLG